MMEWSFIQREDFIEFQLKGSLGESKKKTLITGGFWLQGSFRHHYSNWFIILWIDKKEKLILITKLTLWTICAGKLVDCIDN